MDAYYRIQTGIVLFCFSPGAFAPGTRTWLIHGVIVYMLASEQGERELDPGAEGGKDSGGDSDTPRRTRAPAVVCQPRCPMCLHSD